MVYTVPINACYVTRVTHWSLIKPRVKIEELPISPNIQQVVDGRT